MLQINNATQTVMGMLQSGTAFDTSSITAVGAIRTQLQSTTSLLSSLPVDGLENATSLLNNAVGAEGPLARLGTHMTEQFSALPQRLNTFVSDLGLSQGLGDTPPFPTLSNVFGGAGGDSGDPAPSGDISDICGSAEGFFGSIMGRAQEAMNTVQGFIGQINSAVDGYINQLQSAIGTVVGDVRTALEAGSGAVGAAIAAATGAVRDAIDAATSAVQSAISTVTAQVNEVMGQITTMINTEVQNLTEAVQRMLNFTNAISLRGLFNHPCARNVLGAVGTPDLVNNLSVLNG